MGGRAVRYITAAPRHAAGSRRRRALGHLPGAVAARRRGRRGAAPPGNFPLGLERAEGVRGNARLRRRPTRGLRRAPAARWKVPERALRRPSRPRLSALGLGAERRARGPALGTAGLRGRGAGRGSLGGVDGRVEELKKGRGSGRRTSPVSRELGSLL